MGRARRVRTGKVLKNAALRDLPRLQGKRHPNPAKSTLREVGHVKAIIRVLDEDPQFENEPFFPWLYSNLKCMLSRVLHSGSQPPTGR